MRALALSLVLAGCWTNHTPRSTPVTPVQEANLPARVQGLLRVDADGVRVEVNGGSVRTAEPPSVLWAWANGAHVDVTLDADRQHIASMRVLDTDFPYREVGPVESVRGVLIVESGMLGSVRAGEDLTFFDTVDDQRFGVFGPHRVADDATIFDAKARKLVANMSFTDRETEADLYFVP